MADIKSDGSEVLHYDQPDFPVFIRKNIIPPNACFSDISLHWHDDLEFIYVLSGDIGYYVDGEHVVMRAGEGIFVNARHMHLICNADLGCTLLCIIFPPTVLCSTEFIASKMVNPVLNAKELAYLLLSEQVPWQKEILTEIKEIYDNSLQENGEPDIMAAIYRLWGTLYRNIDVKTVEKHKDENLILMKRMLDYLYENYDKKITLNDICAQAGIGKNKCTELFHRYTNMSPMDYLRNYRVEKGVELLRETDLSVTEIAYEVGMSGASYFAESLRKYRGCSPLQIRKDTKNE
ncbi:MAG: AraC family transcriptional regulator [Lachnospiraceae bacterium]|nr:AraC family transcriptional regulator [Lachnospiraceae bacterium]